MRRYADLTLTQQDIARQQALEDIVQVVCEGLQFSDILNKDCLQARINGAFREAERLQTPWFAGEIMLEDDYIRESFESMARADAEDAHYPDPMENVIRLRRTT